MSAVFPTRGSPARHTVTGLERWGEDIAFFFCETKRMPTGKDAERTSDSSIESLEAEEEKKCPEHALFFRSSLQFCNSQVFFFFSTSSLRLLFTFFLEN